MAREISFSKRAKISQAQQYMILAVAGSTALLGVAIALVLHFTSKISFNADVITAADEAMVNYTKTISGIGVCKKPSGSVYTQAELNACNPNSISASEVPNTLRSRIMNDVAANANLISVPNEASPECYNQITEKNYTYQELQDFYQAAQERNDQDQIMLANTLIQKCSALRVIPEALPSQRNQEALLSSLNRIFIDSGWEPESLSPNDESGVASFGKNLHTMSVRLAVEANTGTTMSVLRNVERSIRDFNINRATIEWGGSGTLVLNAQATAYYMTETKLTEGKKSISAGS